VNRIETAIMMIKRQGLIETINYDGINVYGDEVATNIKELVKL
jgi:hypothetical protein